jgi:hypothetical protein
VADSCGGAWLPWQKRAQADDEAGHMMTGYCRGFKRLAVTLACSNRRVSATTFPSPSIMRAASTGEPPPSRTCNLSWTILCACPGVTLGVGMLTVTLVARGTPPNSSSCYSHKDSAISRRAAVTAGRGFCGEGSQQLRTG